MTPTESVQEWIASASLEELVTSPHFFGLTTASNVQRAFCRLVDGEPLAELWDDPAVKGALNVQAAPSITRPKEVAWLSAIRTAKSLAAAACCVRLSQRADVSKLRPGEIARIPVLSLDKDKAQAVLNHLIGSVQASPMLRMLILGKPMSDGLMLRHPSGKPVQAMVVAGKRAGSAVVAYWLAGAVFDEYPRMQGADDAVVNWDETRAAARGRILPGGLILNIGSPHAPWGPAYDMVQTHHGRPTDDLVVLWSNGPDTNPAWWTPERVAEDARTNPDHRTDCLAQFATPEEAFFSVDQVDGSLRAGELAPVPGAAYAAFIDPATRGNAFTLVIVTREGRTMRMVLAREWIGTRDNPLDTGAVLTQIAAICAPYRITYAATDQYLGDALASQARERGFALHIWPNSEQQKLDAALCFRTKLGAGEVQLTSAQTWRAAVGWTETRNVVLDVQRVKKAVTQASSVVKLPLTTDGRHCDFWPPISMAIKAYLGEPETPPKVESDEVREMREAAIKRYTPQKDDDE